MTLLYRSRLYRLLGGNPLALQRGRWSIALDDVLTLRRYMMNMHTKRRWVMDNGREGSEQHNTQQGGFSVRLGRNKMKSSH